MLIARCFVFLSLITFTANAQYTETINSNRPGTSHGAFAIGWNVFQVETGVSSYSMEHKNLNNSEIDGYKFNYLFRYGLLNDKLEVFLEGSVLSRNVLDNNYQNNYSTEISETLIGEQTIGFKYLVFDPFKNKKWHGENFYSWKAGRVIKLTDFIPALSVMVGSGFNFDDKINYSDQFFEMKKTVHPDLLNQNFTRIRNFNHPIQNISPFVGIATQNHFKGRWVVVNNIFYELAFKNPTFPDYLPKSTNYNTLNYLFTITHNLRNPNWSIFGEFQTFKNGVYSDQLFKFGAAHLISKDIQADLNVGGSLKNTPSLFYLSLGFSKRFDWHIDITDVELKQMKDFKKNQKIQRKAEKDSEKQQRKNDRKGKTILDFFKRGEVSEKKKVRKEIKDLKKESKKLDKETKRQNRIDRKKNK